MCLFPVVESVPTTVCGDVRFRPAARRPEFSGRRQTGPTRGHRKGQPELTESGDDNRQHTTGSVHFHPTATATSSTAAESTATGRLSAAVVATTTAEPVLRADANHLQQPGWSAFDDYT